MNWLGSLNAIETRDRAVGGRKPVRTTGYIRGKDRCAVGAPCRPQLICLEQLEGGVGAIDREVQLDLRARYDWNA